MNDSALFKISQHMHHRKVPLVIDIMIMSEILPSADPSSPDAIAGAYRSFINQQMLVRLALGVLAGTTASEKLDTVATSKLPVV